MAQLTPQTVDFEDRVRTTAAAQPFLKLIGARLDVVEPGYVELRLAARPDLGQQHGYVHGGVTATLADVAGGFAALSLMSAESQVLTVEFKINLLAPATGEALIARGEVVRPGGRLTVCQSDVYAIDEADRETLIASCIGTFATTSSR